MKGEFNYKLLRKILKNKNMTQFDLVNRLYDLGIETRIDTIKSWFRKNNVTRNTPKLSTIQALAKILDITVDELISDGDEDENNDNISIRGDNNITNNSNFTQNQNISGNNNVIFAGNDCDGTNTSERLSSRTVRKFLDLYAEYGNDKMLLPLIEKLEKMKEIAES